MATEAEGAGVTIELGGWDALRDAALPLRFAVFVDEQRVPAELEVDEFDPQSLHALARSRNGDVIGTARLLPDGHIGRIAVARAQRGRGIGAALVLAMMQAAKARGDTVIKLSAQTHVVPFYARFGFAVSGEPYDDAGIPHVAMQRAP